MGLLDYYKQFEELSDAEVRAQLRRQADERRSSELARRDVLDLSQTTWPRLPGPDVVSAVTYAARRGLNSYSAADRDALRVQLAHEHRVPADRIAIGHGAAALLESAASELLEGDQQIVCAWPSYSLFPAIAVRAHSQLVPARRLEAEAILDVVTQRTRIVLLARPNDPTGELLERAALEHLLTELPEHVAVLLDEALVDYIDAEPVDAAVALLERHPRLVVVRSFSKAWGLAGLRCGYALGGPGAEPLLERLEPATGIGDLAAAGALESLRERRALTLRVRQVAGERVRLAAELREAGFELTDSQANFLWISHPRLESSELTAALNERGILVASGSMLAGDPGALRIQVREPEASGRLLEALLAILGG